MAGVFINGIGCVSAQKTTEGFLDTFEVDENANFLEIQKPEYKDYFSPIASRRMAKGVKNGIVAATLALNEAKITNPDAIITGTGMGCIEDSDKFLKAIIDNKEEFLTPTSFIQSTHNTVASTIAINLGCKGYNFTYVNGAVSFESAVIDAQLQLESGEASSILVGGIEEMTEYTKSIFKLAGIMKADNSGPFNVQEPTTVGSVLSEGATFFSLQNQRTETTYAEVLDLEIYNRLTPEEASDKLIAFVHRNKLTLDAIDAVILGNNGDSQYDGYYDKIAEHLNEIPQIHYKHLMGEFNTVTAMAWYFAAQILRKQEIPTQLSSNGIHRKAYQNILIYNQYRGIDHSFALIRL